MTPAIVEPADVGLIVGALGSFLTILGAFTWTIFRIARGVAQINRAVNHQGPDEPPLIERVKALAETMRRHDEAAAETRDRLASLERLSTSRHAENRESLAGLASGQDEIRKAVGRLGARVSKVEAVRQPGAKR